MSDHKNEDQKSNGKKVYGRPELLKLGSLREMTMAQSSGAPDGMPHMGTGRGGDF